MHRRLGYAAIFLLLGAACGSESDAPDGPKKPDGGDRCEVDLSAFVEPDGAGAPATVKRIAGGGDLFGGPAASGKVGDWILQNDRIRVVVQGVADEPGASPFGGGIVDADLLRQGEGRDIIGKVAPLFGFGRTIRPKSEADFFVVSDGSDGKAAVLGVASKDTAARGLAVARAIDEHLPAGSLAMDPAAPLGVDVTQYYILAPGARRVRSVTAFCSKSEAPRVIAVGDSILPGAATERYLPDLDGDTGGWGATDGLTAAPWIAFQGEGAAYALVPSDGAGPNVVLTSGGIGVTIQGTDSLVPYTKFIDAALPPAGSVVVPPGGKAVYERSLVVGTTVDDLVQAIFTMGDVETGRISGRVTGGYEGGAGARVLVTQDGKPVTVFTADVDGRFDGLLPVGSYAVSASLPRMIGPDTQVNISAAGTTTADLKLPDAGRLEIRIEEFDPRGGDPEPVPGRAVVRCLDKTCDKLADPKKERFFREVEARPADAQDVVWVGHATGNGTITVDLVPGDYDVILANGPEYEVYPMTFTNDNRGVPKIITAGHKDKLTGRIARVVDTTGWISADLRVRSYASFDSRTSPVDRLAGLLSEGVEVLVAADRNTVTDYVQAAGKLNSKPYLAVLGGTEAATTGFGGIGAFPIMADPSLPGSGAIVWTDGDGSILAPGAIFEAARTRGASLVQINDARGPNGLFSALRLDTRTLATRAAPESLGIAPPEGTTSSDSRLFSEKFDALEILNGRGPEGFRAMLNDWTTFLGRGLMVTGTASSGSGGRLVPTAGAPRSWVRVGAGNDDPARLETAAFTQAIKERHVVAGYGPFLRVTAKAGGATADVGDVIASGGGEVELEVEAQSPPWMKYNRLEVYSYRTGAEATDGKPNLDLPLDAVAVQSDGSPARRSLSMVGTGFNENVIFVDDQGETLIRVRNVVRHTFRFKPERDTFYIVVARTAASRKDGLDNGEAAPPSMAPVVFGAPGLELRPTSFANPIFVDVDGGGYDRPPGR